MTAELLTAESGKGYADAEEATVDWSYLDRPDTDPVQYWIGFEAWVAEHPREVAERSAARLQVAHQ